MDTLRQSSTLLTGPIVSGRKTNFEVPLPASHQPLLQPWRGSTIEDTAVRSATAALSIAGSALHALSRAPIVFVLLIGKEEHRDFAEQTTPEYYWEPFSYYGSHVAMRPYTWYMSRGGLFSCTSLHVLSSKSRYDTHNNVVT
jgi:hypothetical protein